MGEKHRQNRGFSRCRSSGFLWTNRVKPAIIWLVIGRLWLLGPASNQLQRYRPTSHLTNSAHVSANRSIPNDKASLQYRLQSHCRWFGWNRAGSGESVGKDKQFSATAGQCFFLGCRQRSTPRWFTWTSAADQNRDSKT